MGSKTTIQFKNPLEIVGFILGNGTDCRFISLVTETPVKDIRAACPFRGVLKVSSKTGLVNMDYAAAVERRVAEFLNVPAKEVEYKPKETWYVHRMTADNPPKTLPLVYNKKHPDNGEYYLQFFPLTSKNVYKMPNGDPVSESDLEPWFYKRDAKSEFKPAVITVSLANIKRFAASGVVMQAEDLDEAKQALANF